MTPKVKKVVTNRLRGECQTGARTLVQTGRHEILIDEPVERGGTGLGPSPVETMLSALVACTNRLTHTIAGRHGISIDGLDVDVVAKFDRMCLEEDIAVPFPEIDLNIAITTNATDAEIKTLKRELPMYCPVSKVFRQSGTIIRENWDVARPD